MTSPTDGSAQITGSTRLNGPEQARGLRRAHDVVARVSPLELFFDLVFVFALTQVTTMVAAEPVFGQLARGLMVLAALWWTWAGYAWLTSTVDPERGVTRAVVFGAMGSFLVVALATPGAFGVDALLWGAGYLVARALHIALFALAARGAPALARKVTGLLVAAAPGTGLIITASALADGTTRDVLWLVAIILDYGIVLASGVDGWHVHAEHFAERFGLVVLIALGESIVAIGVGTSRVSLDMPAVTTGLLALAVACLLWWAYFDGAAHRAELRFRAAADAEKLRIARDAYALLHLPMVAGIVLFALGVKKSIEHATHPLSAMPAVALCGGLALYALAHAAFRARTTHRVDPGRLAVSAACTAQITVAVLLPAIATLALLLLTWSLLTISENWRRPAPEGPTNKRPTRSRRPG